MKKVILLGAGGKTGLSYARLLLKEGFEVYAYDQRKSIRYPEYIVNDQNFKEVSEEELKNFQILRKTSHLTLSPGVPLKLPIIQEAKKQKKIVFSELDFCWPFLENKKWVGITGTDGKSTTVTLLEHMLNHFSKRSIACGNLGIPFSQVVLDSETLKSKYVLIAELSSYQLELADSLQLDIAALLNISYDHLDRYESFEEYAHTKCSIIQKIKEGGMFVSTAWLMNRYESLKKSNIRTVWIDTNHLYSRHFSWKSEKDDLILFNDKKQIILSSNESPLKGVHNLENILFALEIVHALDKGEMDTRKIKDAILSFTPLSHRFEYVQGGHPSITYINDSKATTSQAVLNAISNVKEKSYLFLGGKGKGEDYTALAKEIKNRQLKVLLFGSEREILFKALDKEGCSILGKFEGLEESFRFAHRDHGSSTHHKTVSFLLAPACTSWDQYSSFEERGEHFKKLVRNITDI